MVWHTTSPTPVPIEPKRQLFFSKPVPGSNFFDMKIKYPKNLKTSGRKFYKRVLKEFLFEDTHDLERLTQAAACLDEIFFAEQQIEKDGRFFKSESGIIREHPALRVIRDFRTLFVRITRELNLDSEISEPPRPPSI